MARKNKKNAVPEEDAEEGPSEVSDAAVSAESDSGGGSEEPKGEVRKKKKKRFEAEHPPTTEMIVQALRELDDKKGSTIPAIKSFILAHNTVRTEFLSSLLRKALPKLIEKDLIMRPKGMVEARVLMGRYKVTQKAVETEGPRVRPASLRKLGPGGQIQKSLPKKKKKKKRSGFY